MIIEHAEEIEHLNFVRRAQFPQHSLYNGSIDSQKKKEKDRYLIYFDQTPGRGAGNEVSGAVWCGFYTQKLNLAVIILQ